MTAIDLRFVMNLLHIIEFAGPMYTVRFALCSSWFSLLWASSKHVL